MTAPDPALEILIAAAAPPAVEETAFSHRFCREQLRAAAPTAALTQVPPERLTRVGDLVAATRADAILLLTDPEILVPAVAFRALPELLSRGAWNAITPVFNQATEPWLRAAPPFLYHNVRNLNEVAELHFEALGPQVHPVEAAAQWPCLLLRRSALTTAAPDTPFHDLCDRWAREGRLGRADGIYMHRFADYYAAPREDLIDLLPEEATRILDIGCARGCLGRALKARRTCRVTGVEWNPLMAEEARRHYDRVHNQAVEDVDFGDTFEAAICGDIIEHLRDPLAVLTKVRDVLEPGGRLVGSVPNVGHWSIVQDLARGRFELIPVGLLCMSHIRFFTRVELIHLLEQAGFRCELLETDRPQPTPSGERFLRLLADAGAGDEDSLRTAEFRFRAKR